MAAKKLRIDQLRGAARSAAEKALLTGGKAAKAESGPKIMSEDQIKKFADKLLETPGAATIYRHVLSGGKVSPKATAMYKRSLARGK